MISQEGTNFNAAGKERNVYIGSTEGEKDDNIDDVLEKKNRLMRVPRASALTMRWCMVAAVAWILITYIAGHARARVCVPIDYGAKADGAQMDTRAIQDAIDDCAQGSVCARIYSENVFLFGCMRMYGHAVECRRKTCFFWCRARARVSVCMSI